MVALLSARQGFAGVIGHGTLLSPVMPAGPDKMR